MGQASSSERRGAARDEFDVSKVIRLSIASCPGPAGSPFYGFRNVCYEARTLEELFLIFDFRNKWVRAVIGHEGAGCIPSQCNMEDNIGLYHPYWSDGQGRPITRLHIPSQMRQEVFVEEISLMEGLWRWMIAGTSWRIRPLNVAHLEEQDAHADVKHDREIAPGVSMVSWRGCTFVLKRTELGPHGEFEYLRRLGPHPNIVSSFGVLCKRLEESNSDVQNDFFMEYISGGDLLCAIVQKKGHDPRAPPFSPHDGLQVLLQIATAVKHMHQQGVVHCDLKSANVLISDSNMAASSSETVSRYRVKVADFGSARLHGGPDDPFIAGPGTTHYAAPESLRQRGGRPFVINHPDKIDTYSFGIVAFELLTGENYFETYKQHGIVRFKVGVIDGALRPPLRQVFLGGDRHFFERAWHSQPEDLLSLVEKCWHHDPAARPSFEDICEGLVSIDARFR